VYLDAPFYSNVTPVIVPFSKMVFGKYSSQPFVQGPWAVTQGYYDLEFFNGVAIAEGPVGGVVCFGKKTIHYPCACPMPQLLHDFSSPNYVGYPYAVASSVNHYPQQTLFIDLNTHGSAMWGRSSLHFWGAWHG